MASLSSFQPFADLLIKEGMLLTALELHAELSEKGKPLRTLREFFENAANFEKFTRTKLPEAVPPSPALSTSSVEGLSRGLATSQATLDSMSLLEAARCSEDSRAQQEDRLAVLEFELRKARETINNLRCELTSQAARIRPRHKSESGRQGDSLDESVANGGDGVSPDEDDEDDDDLEIRGHEQRALNYLVNEYLLRHGYKLTSITFSDENSDEDFEDWDSIGLNVAKPPNLLRLYRDFGNHAAPPPKESATIQCQTEQDDSPVEEVVALEAKLQAISDDHEREIQEFHAKLSASDAEIASKGEEVEGLKDLLEQLNGELSRQRLKESDVALPEPEESRHQPDRQDSQEIEGAQPSLKVSGKFLSYMKSHCLAPADMTCGGFHIPAAGDDGEESDRNEMLNAVVAVLSGCLPKIVPNVILAKRDELIPLLIATIQVHPEAKVRDQFLNILFNLIKRPDEEQRRIILGGFLSMAARFGPARIEAELLPQCWEQIAHKYDERRILVAETCGTLMPYIPSPLRRSLLLSMLQEMAVEDRDLEVRKSAIRSLAVLVFYLDDGDQDKFESLWQLTVTLLDAPAEDGGEILAVAQATLFLAMTHWALNLGSLLSVIVADRMAHLSKISVNSEDSTTSGLGLLAALKTMEMCLPFVMFHVIKSAPMIEAIQVKAPDDNGERSLEKSVNLSTIVGSEERARSILDSFRDVLEREWFEMWPELQWVLDNLLQKIPTISNSIVVEAAPGGLDENVENLILLTEELVVKYIGLSFSKLKFSPHFEAILSTHSGPEDEDTQGATDADSALKPVYALGILRHILNPLELTETLTLWAVVTIKSGHSATSLKYIVRRLAQSQSHQNALAEMAWSLVVHQSPRVRCFAASQLDILAASVAEQDDDLTSGKILPGFVTLSSDPDEDVRISAIRGLGTILSASGSRASQAPTIEKSCFQFVFFLDKDAGHSHYAYMEAIVVAGEIWSAMPSKLREDVFLPKIANVYSIYGTE